MGDSWSFRQQFEFSSGEVTLAGFGPPVQGLTFQKEPWQPPCPFQNQPEDIHVSL